MPASPQPAAAPSSVEGALRESVPSMARAAEELVRSGNPGCVAYAGASLTTRFQPIFCARRATCVGYEALVRADADGQPIGARELFARASGPARVMLDWACRALHLRDYARYDPGDRMLHINVHPEAAAHDADAAAELGGLIRYYGLAPKRVCVAITAHGGVDEARVQRAVAIYRELGVVIALDDFGRGASSFERALALRPDLVKLERGLLGGAVLGRARARRMLTSMVEMLHDLNARVVISGVETAVDAYAALDARADYLQGFFLGPPREGLDDDVAARERLAALLGPNGRPVAV